MRSAAVSAALVFLAGCRPSSEDLQRHAELQAILGDYGGAEASYAALRGRQDVDDLALRLNLAMLAHAQGRCEEAQEALLDLRAEGVDGASLRLAICLREQGREQEALACALEAAPEPGRDQEVADLLAATGRSAEATVRYALLLTPDPLTAYNLASSLMDEGYLSPGLAFSVLEQVDPSDELFPYALELAAAEVQDPSDLLDLAAWHREHHQHESQAAARR